MQTCFHLANSMQLLFFVRDSCWRSFGSDDSSGSVRIFIASSERKVCESRFLQELSNFGNKHSESERWSCFIFYFKANMFQQEVFRLKIRKLNEDVGLHEKTISIWLCENKRKFYNCLASANQEAGSFDQTHHSGLRSRSPYLFCNFERDYFLADGMSETIPLIPYRRRHQSQNRTVKVY